MGLEGGFAIVAAHVDDDVVVVHMSLSLFSLQVTPHTIAPGLYRRYERVRGLPPPPDPLASALWRRPSLPPPQLRLPSFAPDPACSRRCVVAILMFHQHPGNSNEAADAAHVDAGEALWPS